MAESPDFRQNRVGASPGIEKRTGDSFSRSHLIAKLPHVLRRAFEQQPVSLAYLYGSMATGQLNPFSDVDLALVIEGGLPPLERLKLILRTQVDLADCCDVAKADVRILNDAPLVFQGRVLCDGILVYVRDEQERIAFETGTRLRYFDYLPVHHRLQDAFFANLRERGLYG